jgi:hypothetical protein
LRRRAGRWPNFSVKHTAQHLRVLGRRFEN